MAPHTSLTCFFSPFGLSESRLHFDVVGSSAVCILVVLVNCSIGFVVECPANSSVHEQFYFQSSREEGRHRRTGNSHTCQEKCVGMSVSSPNTCSPQIPRQLCAKPDINNRHMPPQFANQTRGRETSPPVDDHNTVQPGRTGLLAAGSEPCQFLHKPFGDGTIKKSEGFQRGEK